MSLENAFIEQLAQYIEINYKEYLPVTDENILYEKYAPFVDIPERKELTRDQSMDLQHLLDEAGDSFHEKLFELIDKSGMSDVEVYKRACIDRRLFSKIRSNPAYHPGKSTVLALVFALKLDIKAARDLLARAEYALSPSNKGDLIIKYFIEHQVYDLMPLPGGCYLVADTKESLSRRMEKDDHFVRAYSKNKMYTGKHIATKLWVGDYTTGDTFEEFAKKSKGINRIGVLRADVDSLGQAIVSGFQSKRNGDRYMTLSRTAALSRQLSIFFKYYIRSLLKNGEYSLEGNEGVKERQATIVYSGGDDVFIVGAWNDVIELSVDLQKMFRKYTQGTLSISAGIGIYEDSYPIAAIAQETGAMESESKRMPGKNAVTIMEDGERHLVEEGEEEKEISDGTYSWEEFDQEVIQEKYRALSEFFEDLEDRGMAFLYRMLELVRGHEEKINFARMMYLLSRLEPSEEGPKKEKYRQLSKKMYEWIQSDQDCRQLKTAINLYAYMNRKGEGKDED